MLVDLNSSSSVTILCQDRIIQAKETSGGLVQPPAGLGISRLGSGNSFCLCALSWAGFQARLDPALSNGVSHQQLTIAGVQICLNSVVQYLQLCKTGLEHHLAMICLWIWKIIYFLVRWNVILVECKIISYIFKQQELKCPWKTIGKMRSFHYYNKKEDQWSEVSFSCRTVIDQWLFWLPTHKYKQLL